ncbi:hypothetical protein MTCOM_19300 [Moorella thermoacetica]
MFILGNLPISHFPVRRPPRLPANRGQYRRRLGPAFLYPGQGNIVGNPVIPVIKICANPVNVATMSEDIDVDAEALSHKEFILTNRSAS